MFRPLALSLHETELPEKREYGTAFVSLSVSLAASADELHGEENGGQMNSAVRIPWRMRFLASPCPSFLFVWTHVCRHENERNQAEIDIEMPIPEGGDEAASSSRIAEGISSRRSDPWRGS